jgi:KaiC/GvpD/RAD55 family RecA-like ATPase/redox-sensitive bicupin YhaK (pirin superfamily)
VNGVAITILRTSAERRHDRRGKGDAWRTFFPGGAADPLANGFGPLQGLDEERLPPGATLSPAPGEGALLTFVVEGALKVDDPEDGTCVLRAGGLQRSGGGTPPRARNASRTEWAHVIQLGLGGSGESGAVGCERSLFTAADRRGRLLVLASPDGREGSLRIPQDARLHAALLQPGQHVVHELPQGRGAWLHVVQGGVALGGVVLSTGDGAGVTGSRAVSITARQPSSVLLLDLGNPPQPRFPGLPGLSGVALFGQLWEAIVEILGPVAATAALRRAIRRALPGRPELGAIDVARLDGGLPYSPPKPFDAAIPADAVRDLFRELRPLLEGLTGQVLARRLERHPQFREWLDDARRPGGRPTSAREGGPAGPSPTEALSTGSPALDRILGGGLPVGSLLVVAGAPGTGKSLAALQALFHLARQGRKGAYFATLSEPSLRSVRHAMGLSFYDARAIGDRLAFVDLSTAIRGGDATSILGAIVDGIEREEPTLVVIDTFRAIRDLLGGPSQVRKFVYDLGVQVACAGATALLLGEYTEEELATLPEFAVADGILHLAVRSDERGAERSIEVRKLRGGAPAPGRHRFEIGAGGLTFPAGEP